MTCCVQNGTLLTSVEKRRLHTGTRKSLGSKSQNIMIIISLYVTIAVANYFRNRYKRVAENYTMVSLIVNGSEWLKWRWNE